MTFLDQIRLKQIDETLNYDKIMRQRAFNIEKLNANKNNEEDLQEYSQLNDEDIGAVKELVNNLTVLLEKKYNELDKFIRNNSTDVSKEISNVEDVINSYNKIVSIYLNPGNTQQTKSTILTNIMKIEQYIIGLETHCENILNQLYKLLSSRRFDPKTVSIVFPPVFYSYVAYNLINIQLSNSNINIISSRDIKSHFDKISNDHPTWRQLLEIYGYPDYKPLRIIGPSGQGPPPPRKPPGGGGSSGSSGSSDDGRGPPGGGVGGLPPDGGGGGGGDGNPPDGGGGGDEENESDDDGGGGDENQQSQDRAPPNKKNQK